MAKTKTKPKTKLKAIKSTQKFYSDLSGRQLLFTDKEFLIYFRFYSNGTIEMGYEPIKNYKPNPNLGLYIATKEQFKEALTKRFGNFKPFEEIFNTALGN